MTEEKCPACGEDTYTEPKENRLGLYCIKCGWIRWLPQNWSDFIMPFGKYKGKTISEIKEIDFNYIQWGAENIDIEDIQNKFEEALKN